MKRSLAFLNSTIRNRPSLIAPSSNLFRFSSSENVSSGSSPSPSVNSSTIGTDHPYFTQEQLQKRLSDDDIVAFLQGRATRAAVQRTRLHAKLEWVMLQMMVVSDISERPTLKIESTKESVRLKELFDQFQKQIEMLSSGKEVGDMDGIGVAENLAAGVWDSFRIALLEANQPDQFDLANRTLESLTTAFMNGAFVPLPAHLIYPSWFQRVHNWIALRSFKYQVPEFREEDFIEGAKIAYTRITDLLNRRDLANLGRLSSMPGKVAIAFRLVREDVVNRRMVKETVKIHEAFVHSAGVWMTQLQDDAEENSDMAMRISTSFVSAEKLYVVDCTTGKKTCDPSNDSVHTAHRVWSFECPYEDFEVQHYAWKFGGAGIEPHAPINMML